MLIQIQNQNKTMKVMNKSFIVKHYKQMKIWLAQGILALLLTGTSFAHSGASQLLDKEISINIREVPFEQMLTELSAIANIKFAYSIDQLNVKEPVSLQAEKRTLHDILEELLDRHVVVRPIEVPVHACALDERRPQQLHIGTGATINVRLHDSRDLFLISHFSSHRLRPRVHRSSVR